MKRNRSKYSRQYYLEHREKNLRYAAEYRKTHPRKLTGRNTKFVKKYESILTPELLTDLYLNKKLTTLEISKIVNIHQSVIISYLKYNNIKRRNPSEHLTYNFTKEFLVEEYVNKGKSTRDIAKEQNVSSHHTITRHLKNFGIKLRKPKTKLEAKIIRNLRSLTYQILHGLRKSKSTLQRLGCSVEEFKRHIESQFQPGMTWDNYGTGHNGKGMLEWHFDHIRPCASFNLKNQKEQAQCFHYSNFQPLWAKENLIKRDKYVISNTESGK